MSLARRKSEVAEAEARADACIERARAQVAAARSDRDSPLYPASVAVGGLLTGVLAEHVVSPGGRTSTPGSTSEERSASRSPSWLSLANLGLALRLWHQAKPMLAAFASSGTGAAAGSSTAASATAGAEAAKASSAAGSVADTTLRSASGHG